jgi:hypothetical protein
MAFEPIDAADRLEPLGVLDRRRPGRRNELRPGLIALLRGKNDSDVRPEEIIWASDDPGSSAWGTAIDVLIAIIFLGLAGLALWVVFE